MSTLMFAVNIVTALVHVIIRKGDGHDSDHYQQYEVFKHYTHLHAYIIYQAVKYLN